MRPYVSIAVRAMASQLAGSATSTSTAVATPPVERISAATCSALSRWMSATMTEAPSAAIRVA